MKKISTIDFHAVRLCFQVFLPDGKPVIAPIVSNIITNKKAHGDLKIIDYQPKSCQMNEGVDVLVFCEKTMKGDLEVHFDFPNDGKFAYIKIDFTWFGAILPSEMKIS